MYYKAEVARITTEMVVSILLKISMMMPMESTISMTTVLPVSKDGSRTQPSTLMRMDVMIGTKTPMMMEMGFRIWSTFALEQQPVRHPMLKGVHQVKLLIPTAEGTLLSITQMNRHTSTTHTSTIHMSTIRIRIIHTVMRHFKTRVTRTIRT